MPGTVLSVTELMNSDEYTGTTDADEVIKRYRIETDGLHATSYDIVVECIQNNDLPARGEQLSAGSSLQARRIDLKRAGHDRIWWVAEVEFDNQIISNSEEEGFKNANRYDPQNPENDEPTWNVSSSTVMRPNFIDYRGAPCINSAGDPLDPVPELKVTAKVITLEFNRLEPLDRSDWAGAVNQDYVRLGNQIVNPYQGVVEGFEVSGPNYRFFTASGGTQSVVEYYTHRLSLNVILGSLPSNIGLLDPLSRSVNANQLYEMGTLKRPDNANIEVDYWVQGDIKANVGFNMQTKLTNVSVWNAADTYAVGTRVSNGTKLYRAIAVSTGITPGFDDGWEDSWQEIYCVQPAAGVNVGLRRILRGDVEPFVPVANMLDPIDTPAYLAPDGQLNRDQVGGSKVYGVWLCDGPLKSWSQLEPVTPLAPPPDP